MQNLIEIFLQSHLIKTERGNNMTEKDLMRSIPKEYKPFAKSVVLGDKIINPKTGRWCNEILIEWKSGLYSSFVNAHTMRRELRNRYTPLDFI